MSSSTTHAGSVSIVAAPNSCNHRRIARTVRSVAVRRARRTTERGPHDPARTIRVGHRHGLLQRADVVPTILERRTRPIVRRPELAWARRCQPRPQERPEQVVVAVPAPPLIQGHDEQVGGEQVVEQCRRLFDCP